MKYDVYKEYINIDNYSPFAHINEVSEKYKKSSFSLPFIEIFSEERPIHPDTFDDLGLEDKDIVRKVIVFPTSSFRTVYNPEQNICYKLPILRKITRSIRSLSYKEIERSERAGVLLSTHQFNGFGFLPERGHKAPDPNFNYIVRVMSETECFPWFYVIKSQQFNIDFEMRCMFQIIKSWMFLASKGIFLESPHTQNILVDNECNVYYRDLSDVRVVNVFDERDLVLLPSYYGTSYDLGDVLSVIFDRAVCNQNLNHLFKYSKKLGDKEKGLIKELINSEIERYQLPFPNYSMDFPKDIPERIPQKVELVFWRKFGKNITRS